MLSKIRIKYISNVLEDIYVRNINWMFRFIEGNCAFNYYEFIEELHKGFLIFNITIKDK